jgi:isoamylase
VFLNGEEVGATTARGEEVRDDSFLVLFNAHHEEVTFRLPTRRFGAAWSLVLSTSDPDGAEGCGAWSARDDVPVESRSVLVLRRGS